MNTVRGITIGEGLLIRTTVEPFLQGYKQKIKYPNSRVLSLSLSLFLSLSLSLSLIVTWMNMKDIMSNEVSQTQKDKTTSSHLYVE
jgi:hypothetical protein